jgi:hypothetical protein
LCIMEVTTVTITVTGRRSIVPGRRSKRIAKKVVSPGQILIFLTHAHPLELKLSVGAERFASKEIQGIQYHGNNTDK